MTANEGEHEGMQKKTFTKWINYHLETHSSSGRVTDLYEDLRDGVLLCHLVEVLTGEALPITKTKQPKRAHHLHNLDNALKCLKRRGLILNSNNPANIADGNPHATLGLIWQLVLHFQIETGLYFLHENGQVVTEFIRLANGEQEAPLGNGNEPSTSFSTSLHSRQQKELIAVKLPVERVLLHWINSEIMAALQLPPLNDFDQSWRNGVAFCAQVHHFCPPLIDMGVVVRRAASAPAENLQLAFETARLHLNVRPLLDAEDFEAAATEGRGPDKRSIITYISQFLRVINTLTFTDGEADDGTQVVSTTLTTTTTTVTTTEKTQQELKQLCRRLDLYRPLLEWLESVIKEPRVVDRNLAMPPAISTSGRETADRLATDIRWYTQLRREFLERRVLYQELIEYLPSKATAAAAADSEEEEQANFSERWETLSDAIHHWSETLRERLPKDYVRMFEWANSVDYFIFSKAAPLLQRISEDGTMHVSKTVDEVEQIVGEAQALMSLREEMRVVADQIDEEDAVVMALIRDRIDSTSEQLETTLAMLESQLLKHRLLKLIGELRGKMHLWEKATSLAITKRWLDDARNYLEKEEPMMKLEELCSQLTKQKTPHPTQRDKTIAVAHKDLSDEALRIKEQFNAFQHRLAQIHDLWLRLEELAASIEMVITDTTRTTLDDNELLSIKMAECGSIVEAMMRLEFPLQVIGAARHRVDTAVRSLRRFENTPRRHPNGTAKVDDTREKITGEGKAIPTVEEQINNGVQSLLRQKEELIRKVEKTEAEVEATLAEMGRLNEAVQLGGQFLSAENQQLEVEWREKLASLDRFLLLAAEIKRLAKMSEKCRKTAKFEALMAELQALQKGLESGREARLPPLLRDNVLRQLQLIIQTLEERFKESTEYLRRRESFKRRLHALETSSEDGLKIAEAIVIVEDVKTNVASFSDLPVLSSPPQGKDISEEVRKLAEKDPDYQSVAELAESLRESLKQKMDFFAKLENLADQLDALGQEQAAMSSISVAKTESLALRLREQLDFINGELEPQQKLLERLFNDLQDQFLVAENARIGQRLSTMAESLAQKRTLTRSRIELLQKVVEYQAVVHGIEERTTKNVSTETELQLRRLANEVNQKQQLAEMDLAGGLDVEQTLRELKLNLSNGSEVMGVGESTTPAFITNVYVDVEIIRRPNLNLTAETSVTKLFLKPSLISTPAPVEERNGKSTKTSEEESPGVVSRSESSASPEDVAKTSNLYASSSAEPIARMYIELSAALLEGKADVATCMRVVEETVEKQLEAVQALQSKYDSPPLKSLREAEEDVACLKAHIKELDIHKVETKNLLNNPSLDIGAKKGFSKLLKSIKQSKNGAKSFHKALMREVESEVNLRLNYQQVMANLGALEDGVRTASSPAVSPQKQSPANPSNGNEEALKRVELEIELLRKQSAAQRKYVKVGVVTDSREGSPTGSPDRQRRRILLRITNSVTTVLQVVEEHLRRNGKEEQLQQRPTPTKKSFLFRRKEREGSSTSSSSDKAEEFVTIHRKLSAINDLLRNETGGEPERPEGRQKTPTPLGLSSEGPSPLTQPELSTPPVTLALTRELSPTPLTHVGKRASTPESKLPAAEGKKLADYTLAARLRSGVEWGEEILRNPHASVEELGEVVERTRQLLHDVDEYSAAASDPTSTLYAPEFVAAIAEDSQKLRMSLQRLEEEHRRSARVVEVLSESYTLLEQLNPIVGELTERLQHGSPSMEEVKLGLAELEKKEGVVKHLRTCKGNFTQMGVHLPVIEEINSSLGGYDALKAELERCVDGTTHHEPRTPLAEPASTPPQYVVPRGEISASTTTAQLQKSPELAAAGRIGEEAQPTTPLPSVVAANRALVERARELNCLLAQLLDESRRSLNDPAEMPHHYGQHSARLGAAAEEAATLIGDAATTSSPRGDELVGLELNLACAKEEEMELSRRWKLWTEFVSLRDETSRQLGEAEMALNAVESKSARTLDEAQADFAYLMDEQASLALVRDKLDELRTMASQLGPLEAASNTLQFIDTYSTQTAAEFDRVLGEMRREIDEENCSLDISHQLLADVDELIANAQRATEPEQISACLTRVAELQRQIEAMTVETATRKVPARSMVQPSPPPPIEDLKARVAAAATVLSPENGGASTPPAQADTRAIKAKLDSLKAAAATAAVPMEAVLELDEELRALPLEEEQSHQLEAELAQIKEECQRKHNSLRRLSEKSEAVAKQLDRVYQSYLSRTAVVSHKPRKKKKAKRRQKPSQMEGDSELVPGSSTDPGLVWAPVAITEEEKGPAENEARQIAELKQAIGELEGEILPSLHFIDAEAQAEGLESFPTEFASEKPLVRATQLVEKLKLELLMREGENRQREQTSAMHPRFTNGLGGVSWPVEVELPESSTTHSSISPTRQPLDAEPISQGTRPPAGTEVQQIEGEPPNGGVPHKDKNPSTTAGEEERSRLAQQKAAEEAMALQRSRAIAEFKARKTPVEEDLSQLEREIDSQYAKCSAALQSVLELQDSERWVRSLAELRSTAIRKEVTELHPLVETNSDALDGAEVTQLERRVEADELRLWNLLHPLHMAVEACAEMQAEKDGVVEQLDEMARDAKLFYSVDDPAVRKEGLSKLRAALEALSFRLEQLENRAARECHSPVVADYGLLLDLGAIRHNLQQLLAVVRGEESAAEEGAQLTAIASQIEQAHAYIDAELAKVEQLTCEPRADEDQLKRATALLTMLDNHFRTVEDLCAQLDTLRTESANSLRNSAFERQSKLGEQTRTLKQSLDDTLNALHIFNEGVEQVEKQLTSVRAELEGPMLWRVVEDGSLDVSLHQLRTGIEKAKALADSELTVLAEPYAQLEGLAREETQLSELAGSVRVELSAARELESKLLALTSQLNALVEDGKVAVNNTEKISPTAWGHLAEQLRQLSLMASEAADEATHHASLMAGGQDSTLTPLRSALEEALSTVDELERRLHLWQEFTALKETVEAAIHKAREIPASGDVVDFPSTDERLAELKQAKLNLTTTTHGQTERLKSLALQLDPLQPAQAEAHRIAVECEHAVEGCDKACVELEQRKVREKRLLLIRSSLEEELKLVIEEEIKVDKVSRLRQRLEELERETESASKGVTQANDPHVKALREAVEKLEAKAAAKQEADRRENEILQLEKEFEALRPEDVDKLLGKLQTLGFTDSRLDELNKRVGELKERQEKTTAATQQLLVLAEELEAKLGKISSDISYPQPAQPSTQAKNEKRGKKGKKGKKTKTDEIQPLVPEPSRDSRIAQLEKAVNELESCVLPDTVEVAHEDVANERLEETKRRLGDARTKADTLLGKLKLELSTKQEEKTEVLVLMSNVQKLKCLIEAKPKDSTHHESATIDPNGAEVELKLAEERMVAMQELTDSLDQFPRTNLDQQEAVAVDEVKRRAEESLGRLQSSCQELHRQMAMNEQRIRERASLQAQLATLNSKLAAIVSECSTSGKQLQEVEDAIKKCQALKAEVHECRKKYAAMSTDLQKQSPPSDDLTPMLDEIDGRLGQLSTTLQHATERGRQLAARRAKLAEQLQEWHRRTGAAIPVLEPKRRIGELSAMQHELFDWRAEWGALAGMANEDDPAKSSIAYAQMLELAPLEHSANELQEELAKGMLSANAELQLLDLEEAINELGPSTLLKDEALHALEKQLEQLEEILPQGTPKMADLHHRLSEIQAERAAFGQKMKDLAEETEAMHYRLAMIDDALLRGDALASTSRTDAIVELRQTLTDLQEEVVPALERIDSQTPKEQRAQGPIHFDPTKLLAEARVLIEKLQTKLAEIDREQSAIQSLSDAISELNEASAKASHTVDDAKGLLGGVDDPDTLKLRSDNLSKHSEEIEERLLAVEGSTSAALLSSEQKAALTESIEAARKQHNDVIENVRRLETRRNLLLQAGEELPKLEPILQQLEPSTVKDSRLEELDKTLAQFESLNDPRVASLRLRLSEIRGEKAAFGQKMRELAEEAEAMHYRLAVVDDALLRGNALVSTSRTEVIMELRQALTNLKEEVVPALERIDSQTPKEQRAQGLIHLDPAKLLAEARALIEKLQTKLAQIDREQSEIQSLMDAIAELNEASAKAGHLLEDALGAMDDPDMLKLRGNNLSKHGEEIEGRLVAVEGSTSAALLTSEQKAALTESIEAARKQYNDVIENVRILETRRNLLLQASEELPGLESILQQLEPSTVEDSRLEELDKTLAQFESLNDPRVASLRLRLSEIRGEKAAFGQKMRELAEEAEAMHYRLAVIDDELLRGGALVSTSRTEAIVELRQALTDLKEEVVPALERIDSQTPEGQRGHRSTHLDPTKLLAEARSLVLNLEAKLSRTENEMSEVQALMSSLTALKKATAESESNLSFSEPAVDTEAIRCSLDNLLHHIVSLKGLLLQIAQSPAKSLLFPVEMAELSGSEERGRERLNMLEKSASELVTRRESLVKEREQREAWEAAANSRLNLLQATFEANSAIQDPHSRLERLSELKSELDSLYTELGYGAGESENLPSKSPQLENLRPRVEEFQKAVEDAQIAARISVLTSRIHPLTHGAEVDADLIAELDRELTALNFHADPRVEELRARLDQLNEEKLTLERELKLLGDGVASAGTRLKELSARFAPPAVTSSGAMKEEVAPSKKSKKKGKGKKHTDKQITGPGQKEVGAGGRDIGIAELEAAVSMLEGELVPAMEALDASLKALPVKTNPAEQSAAAGQLAEASALLIKLKLELKVQQENRAKAVVLLEETERLSANVAAAKLKVPQVEKNEPTVPSAAGDLQAQLNAARSAEEQLKEQLEKVRGLKVSAVPTALTSSETHRLGEEVSNATEMHERIIRELRRLEGLIAAQRKTDTEIEEMRAVLKAIASRLKADDPSSVNRMRELEELNDVSGVANEAKREIQLLRKRVTSLTTSMPTASSLQSLEELLAELDQIEAKCVEIEQWLAERKRRGDELLARKRTLVEQLQGTKSELHAVAEVVDPHAKRETLANLENTTQRIGEELENLTDCAEDRSNHTSYATHLGLIPLQEQLKALRDTVQQILDSVSAEVDEEKHHQRMKASFQQRLAELQAGAEQLMAEYQQSPKWLENAVGDSQQMEIWLNSMAGCLPSGGEIHAGCSGCESLQKQCISQLNSARNPWESWHSTLLEEIQLVEKSQHALTSLNKEADAMLANIKRIPTGGGKRLGDWKQELGVLMESFQGARNGCAANTLVQLPATQLDALNAKLEAARVKLEVLLATERKHEVMLTEIRTLTERVQRLVKETEGDPSGWESSLPRLEEAQQQLHTQLGSLPEGDKLRKEGENSLSRLTILIQHITSMVAERALALTDFLATKERVEKELDEADHTIEQRASEKSELDPLSRLQLLVAEEERLALLEQGAFEGVPLELLDDERKAEAESLTKAIEMLQSKVGDRKSALELEVARLEAEREQLEQRCLKLNAHLQALVTSANHVLADPTETPQAYEPLAKKLHAATGEAENALAGAQLDDIELVAALQMSTREASKVYKLLEERWQQWLTFASERDSVTDALDSTRMVIEKLRSVGKRSLSQSDSDLDKLKSYSGSITLYKAGVERLRELSNELGGHLEAAAADIRLLDADCEQADHNCKALISTLAEEREEEKSIQNTEKELNSQLASVEASLMRDSGHVEALSKHRATLSTLHTSIDLLRERVENAHANRKLVAPATTELDSLHGRASKLDQSVTRALEAIDYARGLEELAAKIRSMANERLEGDIETVEAELEAYPADNPKANQLRHQLTELKSKRSELQQQLQQLSTPLAEQSNGVAVVKEIEPQQRKVHEIRPKIEAITSTLRRSIDELDPATAPELSVQQYEVRLHNLEQDECELKTLLESIPEDSEGQQLRQKSEWELGRINNFIASLKGVISDKAAKLSAYISTGTGVRTELEKLDQRVEALQKDKSMSPAARLKLLNGEEERVNEFKASLHQAAANVTAAEHKRLVDLYHDIEAALSRIHVYRRELEEEAALELRVAEKRRNEYKATTAELKSLAEQARKLMADPVAVAKLQKLARQLETTLEKAGKSAINAEGVDENDSSLAKAKKQLDVAVQEAEKMLAKLNTSIQRWEEFTRQRELVMLLLRESGEKLSGDQESCRTKMQAPEAGHMVVVSVRANYDDLLHNVGAELSKLYNMASSTMGTKSSVHETKTEMKMLEKSYQNFLNEMVRELDEEDELRQSSTSLSKSLELLGSKLKETKGFTGIKTLQDEMATMEHHLAQLRASIASKRVRRQYIAVADYAAQLNTLEQAQLRELQTGIKTLMARFPGPSPPLTYANGNGHPQNGTNFAGALDRKAEAETAEVLAAIFRDREPQEVLREHGFDDVEFDSSSDVDTLADDEVSELSTSRGLHRYASGEIISAAGMLVEREQVSRWKRVLRTALPLQAMLVLLLGAACLVPYCDEEYCCHLLNNFAKTLNPQLEFPNGQPPF